MEGKSYTSNARFSEITSNLKVNKAVLTNTTKATNRQRKKKEGDFRNYDEYCSHRYSVKVRGVVKGCNWG